MSHEKARRYGREYKVKAVERLEAGESGTALSLELGVKREMLYRWRDTVRAGGVMALREKAGRPRKAEALALAAATGAGAKPRTLAEARRQIAALQRKVGRQQLDLDFFRQALRHFEAVGQPSDRRGAPASTPSSRRGRSGKAS